MVTPVLATVEPTEEIEACAENETVKGIFGAVGDQED
jgi:hypothetical protein